jgi:Fe-S-cluster-containing dehydrogenase component
MTRWAMVIDLDKCVACQGCSIACRQENNTPVVSPEEAAKGRTFRWNDVFPSPLNESEGHGEFPNVSPVQATYRDEEGLIRQDYKRCIGCRFCTVACPYGVRHFNWEEPPWSPELAQMINPDVMSEKGSEEGPATRSKGVVEKCTFCIHRLDKARKQAVEEGREFRAEDYVPACVQTCTARARFFGDLDDPNSSVSIQSKSTRAFHLLEEIGTYPKVIYLREG